jgi:hypothetical protein
MFESSRLAASAGPQYDKRREFIHDDYDYNITKAYIHIHYIVKFVYIYDISTIMIIILRWIKSRSLIRSASQRPLARARSR